MSAIPVPAARTRQPAGALPDAGTLADEEIVAKVLAGETALFEILMRRHNEQVYRAARAILRDEREAEDVMQEAYVNAYSHLAQFDGRAKFSTWLTKIAVYEALGRVRRRGRYESLDEGSLETFMPIAATADPERQAFGRELGGLIESAVDRLGDGYREVFMLRQVQSLSTAETAEVLGLSEDVVKTRFSRARHALQNDLLNRVGGASSEAFTFGQARCDSMVARVMALLVRDGGPLND
jgi:RNA polymerase sigma-70 factor (ECF subfamily)